jgi:DNA primase
MIEQLMNVLDLAKEAGLSPKRSASTRGGEYHSPCPDPVCSGRNRFCIWPNQGCSGGYWCRQCGKNGDAIQFCRDFLGLSFRDACQKVGVQPTFSERKGVLAQPSFTPLLSALPSDLWREKAWDFIKNANLALLKDHKALDVLKARGLTIETAVRFQIGYNAQDMWEERKAWGLNEEIREDGKSRRQWLPAGLVVPTFAADDSTPSKMKVRRSSWKEGDQLPKYVEVSGSQKQYSIYGDRSLVPILVEAELDAILLQQEARAHCCSIALGGAGKRPDEEVHRILRAAPIILFSLDFDNAGKKEYAFWKQTYPQIKAWPAPMGKSPSEAFKSGVDLSEWVKGF